MAANIEKLLLEIKTDIKDLKDLRAELKQVKDEAKAAGKDISQGLSSALTGLASGLSALKIKGIMDNAVNEFNKLEKTMLGLQATARLTGNSFEDLKAQVNKLSSDGVLSIDQASTAMKTLLAQGIKADKAFSLLEAAKKVGAFNNIVGDTGQAVADFVKFLQTGSAELAENLDPSITKVVKSLGGYEKIASDATAKQKLINAVIEKGSQLTSDYEKFLNSGAQAQVSFNSASTALSQTLGQKLQPAYNALYSAGTKLLNGLTALLDKLDSTTVSFVAFSAAGLSAAAGIGKLLAALPGSLGALGAVVAPLIIKLGLVGVAIGGIILAYKKLTYSLREDHQQLAKFGEFARKDVNEFNKLGKSLQDIKVGTKEFAAAKEELIKQSERYGIALKAEIDSQEKLVAAYKKIQLAKEQSLVATITEQQASVSKLKNEYFELTGETYVDSRKETPAQRLERIRKLREAGIRPKSLTAEQKRRAAEIKILLQEEESSLESSKKALYNHQKAIIEAEAESRRGATVSSGKAAPEFRYIELRDQIKELNKEYDNYLARLAQEKGFFVRDKDNNIKNYKQAIARAAETAEGQEATLKLRLSTEDALSKARQEVAEFLEKEYDAKIAKIETQKRAAIAAAYEEYNERVKLAKDDPGKLKEAEEQLQKDLAEIEATASAKKVREGLQSFSRTLGAATDITKGITSATKGRTTSERIGGIGATLESAGKVAPGKVGIILQGAGQVVSMGAQLYDSLKGLFGKSDEEIKKAAEEQAIRDEQARRLLELQADYQRRMLAIQEANADLPFLNLQRQLRLVDISIQQRRLAGESEETLSRERLARRSEIIQSVIREQSGTISGKRLFAGTGSTPEELTAFLAQRAAEAPYVEEFANIVKRALGDVGSIEELSKLRGFLDGFRGKVPDELWNAAVQAVDAKINNFWNIYRFLDSQWARNRVSYEKRSAAINEALRANYATGVRVIGEKGFFDYDVDAGRVEIGARAEDVSANFEELLSEIRSDTKVGENLLSVIEQGLEAQLEIKEAAKKTAENTAKLELLDDRRRSFLDLGNRRIFSQGLNIDFQSVKLPEAAAATILATSPLIVPQSDTVTELKKVVSGIDEINEWLAIIAANTDQRAATDTVSLDNYLIRKLAEIRARRIS